MGPDRTDVFTGAATLNVDICVKIAVEAPDKTGSRVCLISPENRINSSTSGAREWAMTLAPPMRLMGQLVIDHSAKATLEKVEPVAAEAESKNGQNTP
jgi:hypothetical protein